MEPVGHASLRRPDQGTVQERPSWVEGQHLGFGQDLSEETGGHPGSGADIHHPAQRPWRGDLGEPADRLGQPGGGHLGITLELGELGIPFQMVVLIFVLRVALMAVLRAGGSNPLPIIGGYPAARLAARCRLAR